MAIPQFQTNGRSCVLRGGRYPTSGQSPEQPPKRDAWLRSIHHLTIGEGAVLGAKVMSNIPAGERWAGYPAEPATDWKRGQATLRRLVRRRKAERKDDDDADGTEK